MPSRPQIDCDPAREEAELRAYLGERYDHARLVDYDGQLEAEFAEIGDEQALYRRSEAYLYNLTAFAMTRTKVPYLNDLVAAVPPGSLLLDYGCGIGSDGLLLLEAGYRVTFADFDNPSTEYLRWRLARRGFEAEIVDLDAAPPDPGHDLAYAFDVIEHVDDAEGFLSAMETAADRVCVNFLTPVPGETDLHRELDVSALLDRSARRRLELYRVYHERSHLVIYGSELAGGLGRLRSRRVLAAGRRSS